MHINHHGHFHSAAAATTYRQLPAIWHCSIAYTIDENHWMTALMLLDRAFHIETRILINSHIPSSYYFFYFFFFSFFFVPFHFQTRMNQRKMHEMCVICNRTSWLLWLQIPFTLPNAKKSTRCMLCDFQNQSPNHVFRFNQNKVLKISGSEWIIDFQNHHFTSAIRGPFDVNSEYIFRQATSKLYRRFHPCNERRMWTGSDTFATFSH